MSHPQLYPVIVCILVSLPLHGMLSQQERGSLFIISPGMDLCCASALIFRLFVVWLLFQKQI